ncbi:MAG TPA: hypothetical protein VHH09_04275 [Acidimicrobiales bacterium]|nr:hypothetical protein [Acidimicrobiales bacterium]
MIVLLIILVVAAVGGVAAYVAMQYAGVDSRVPSSGGFQSGFIERRGGTVAERIANTPSGCLVAVLIAAGVWIALWLVVLILGLRVFTA